MVAVGVNEVQGGLGAGRIVSEGGNRGHEGLQ